MSQIGFDKTYIPIFKVSNAEIGLKKKMVVCMHRGQNNENFPIFWKFSILIAVICLCARFDYDVLREDLKKAHMFKMSILNCDPGLN